VSPDELRDLLYVQFDMVQYTIKDKWDIRVASVFCFADMALKVARIEATEERTAYIKKEKGKWCVKSKNNPDWSGGCYDTKKEAEERLKQVEAAKYAKASRGLRSPSSPRDAVPLTDKQEKDAYDAGYEAALYLDGEGKWSVSDADDIFIWVMKNDARVPLVSEDDPSFWEWREVVRDGVADYVVDHVIGSKSVKHAKASSSDGGDWVPAAGGTEEPFLTRDGRRLQYMWNPKTRKHAYLDLGTDLILSDEEARRILGSTVFDILAAVTYKSAPEYKSIEDFIQYKMDDEEYTFDHEDLMALNYRLQRPVREIRSELETFGLELEKRKLEEKSRGFTSPDHDRWFGPGSG